MEIPARALILSCMRNGPGVIAILGREKERPEASYSGALEVEDKNEVCKQTVIK